MAAVAPNRDSISYCSKPSISAIPNETHGIHLSTQSYQSSSMLSIDHPSIGGPVYVPGAANNFPLRGGKYVQRGLI